MGIMSLNLLCKVLWDLLMKNHAKVSLIAFPSKCHNHDCIGDQIKKLSWQFPRALNGKKEGQLITPNLSMTSSNQKTAIHFSPLSPSPDLLGEANSHHSRTASKGLRPRYLCIQAWADRRGKGGGRDTDLPTKQGWHNTQERGWQQQHVVAAWGSC